MDIIHYENAMGLISKRPKLVVKSAINALDMMNVNYNGNIEEKVNEIIDDFLNDLKDHNYSNESVVFMYCISKSILNEKKDDADFYNFSKSELN